MDQVGKLYEELTGFDPSLKNNKEAVLQVIEKMIAVKPIVVADPMRKQRFGEQLADHIAQKKTFVPVKTGFAVRVARWGFSFATFFVVMVVAGAAYMGIRLDVGSVKKNIALKNQAQIKSDVSSKDDVMNAQTGDQNNERNGTELRALVKMQTESREGKNKPFINTDLDLRNANTMRVNDVARGPKIIPPGEVSTEVDMLAIVQNNMSTGGVGGGNPEARLTYDAGVKTMMDTSVSGDSVNAKQEAAVDSAVTMSALPPSELPEVVEQKMIAMVFVNDETLLGKSLSTDILKVYNIPATFVEGNSDAAIRAKIQTDTFVDLRGKSLSNVKISMTESHIIVMQTSEVMKDPAKLTMLIEKLQAEGYVFVVASAIQK